MHVVAAGAERTQSRAVRGGLLINSEYSPLLALKFSTEGFQSYLLPFLSKIFFLFFCSYFFRSWRATGDSHSSVLLLRPAVALPYADEAMADFDKVPGPPAARHCIQRHLMTFLAPRLQGLDAKI